MITEDEKKIRERHRGQQYRGEQQYKKIHEAVENAYFYYRVRRWLVYGLIILCFVVIGIMW
jgi:hypothetical protein